MGVPAGRNDRQRYFQYVPGSAGAYPSFSSTRSPRSSAAVIAHLELINEAGATLARNMRGDSPSMSPTQVAREKSVAANPDDQAALRRLGPPPKREWPISAMILRRPIWLAGTRGERNEGLCGVEIVLTLTRTQSRGAAFHLQPKYRHHHFGVRSHVVGRGSRSLPR